MRTLLILALLLALLPACSEFVPRDPPADVSAPPPDNGPNPCATTICDDDNPCTKDRCAPATGQCTFEAIPDGSTCDDGAFCSLKSACQAGLCVAVSPRDCPSQKGGCLAGRCDEASAACVVDIAPSGAACQTEDLCQTGQTCSGGECGGGVTTPCDPSTDPCAVSKCVPETGLCAAESAPNGTDCADQDDDLCSVNETCLDGQCVGEPMDCSGLDVLCTIHHCEVGNCVPQFVADGSACEDDNPCTDADSCTAGICAGAAVDCSSLDGACTAGVCDPSGVCVVQNLEQGCEDGDLCTIGDLCDAGACVPGVPTDCSAIDGPCGVGACDAADGTCKPLPGPDGVACDDQDVCTDLDVCVGGVCTGAPKDCADAAEPCQVGACDPASGACISEPSSLLDGQACDNGQYCEVDTTCLEGQCQGVPRDCSGVAAECQLGVCDDVLDACLPQAMPDGSPCDDGLFCTQSQQCIGGLCAGSDLLDCSALDGPCKTAYCSEVQAGCVVNPAPDASECTDDDACTTADACLAGECVGSPTDCTGLQTDCLAGICDPTDGQCKSLAVPDGAICDDGIDCTVGDICQSGACLSGVPTDCPCPAPARSLELSGGCAQVAGFPFLQDQTGFTVEFWLKTLSTQDAVIMDQRVTADLGESDWHIEYAVDTAKAQLRFRYGNITGFDSQVGMSSVVLNDGQWHHVAVTRDDSLIRWWIDGIGASGNNLSNSQPLSNSSPLLIGCGKFGAPAFSGQLDEIRISSLARYHQAFTPPGRHVRDGSTVALWHADGGGIFGAPTQTLRDATQGGHHGDLTGAFGFVPAPAPGHDSCCGDGTLDLGEECDDGAAATGDGCDDTCTLEVAAPKRSLELDGVDGCAVVAGDGLLSNVSALSVELWVQTTQQGPVTLISKGGGPAGGWRLELDGSGRPVFVTGNTAGGTLNTTANPVVTDGGWHHIAAQVSATHILRIFVDGKALVLSSLASAAPLGTTQDVYMGCAPDGSDHLAGRLDAVRLTAGLVYSGEFIPTADLAPQNATRLLLTMDHPSDGVSGAVLDLTADHHDATLVGGAAVVVGGAP